MKRRIVIAISIFVVGFGVGFYVTGRTDQGFSFSQAWNYPPSPLGYLVFAALGALSGLIVAPLFKRRRNEVTKK